MQAHRRMALILQRVGAVRAMEFDINPDWHTLITYGHNHGLVPTMVGPNPNQSPTRYLVPDDRDFFAIYRRRPGPVTVPFKQDPAVSDSGDREAPSRAARSPTRGRAASAARLPSERWCDRRG